MKNIFKTSGLIGALFISTQITAAQVDSTQYNKIKQLVDQAKSIYAPDGRTKIVEIYKSDVANNRYTIQTTESEAKYHLQNKLKDISSKVELKLLPKDNNTDKNFGVINLSVANLRTKPSHAAEMATQALLGTQVDILQIDGSDYRIRTPEGYISWVPNSSVVPMTKSELNNWKTAKKLIYTEEFGRSFSAADKKSQRISDLVYGNILLLQGESGDFYKVAYPDGRIAYVLKDQASGFEAWTDSREATANNILSSAKSMLGLPYLWGGTSVKGVDCSGFTKTSFFMNGVVIPRDASQQVLHGEAIEILDEKGDFAPATALKNLQPADLIFFAAGKANNPNARVTHVALYIGNGEFIHAAGTVRINSMLKDAANYDDFQTRTVVAARRYINAEDSAIQAVKESSYYN